MSRLFGRIVLGVMALFSLLTAWSSAFAPRQFGESLGLVVANADGYNEIRAQYAGFFLCVAIACAAALWGRVPKNAVFLLLAVLFGGLILGRLASLVLNRGFEGYGHTIVALYAIDALGFALSVASLAVDRKAQQ